jgi:CheY-like chemotaxis protein
VTRILYIDDEADIREVAQMSLELDPEFEVRSCASGPDGIAEAAGWRPTLILLDVMMPGMDGPTTLARLREQPETANIPVVLITARTQAREAEGFPNWVPAAY